MMISDSERASVPFSVYRAKRWNSVCVVRSILRSLLSLSPSSSTIHHTRTHIHSVGCLIRSSIDWPLNIDRTHIVKCREFCCELVMRGVFRCVRDQSGWNKTKMLRKSMRRWSSINRWCLKCGHLSTDAMRVFIREELFWSYYIQKWSPNIEWDIFNRVKNYFCHNFSVLEITIYC